MLRVTKAMSICATACKTVCLVVLPVRHCVPTLGYRSCGAHPGLLLPRTYGCAGWHSQLHVLNCTGTSAGSVLLTCTVSSTCVQEQLQVESYFKALNYLYNGQGGYSVNYFWVGLLQAWPIGRSSYQWVSAAAPAANTTKQLYTFR